MRTVLVAILLIGSASTAGAYCSEPDAPYCATSYGAFDDRSDFDNCRSEMESYRSDVEDYLSCTKRDIDELVRKANRVSEEYDDAVTSFNRRAQQ